MTTRRQRIAASALAACTSSALALTAVGATPGPAGAAGPSGSSAPQAAEPPAPFSIVAPDAIKERRYGPQVYVDLKVRAVAEGSDFLMTSRRASYDEPILTEWTSGATTETLPAGTQTSFAGLDDFLTTTYTSTGADAGEVVRERTSPGCFAGPSRRMRPEAPLANRYPQQCPWNLYTLGSVQGVPEGWGTSVTGWGQPVRLPVGTYDVHVEVSPRYVELFHLDPASASHDLTLTVAEPRRGEGFRARRGPAPTRSDDAAPSPRPAGASGGSAADPAGPRPDLRALPAFGIDLNPKGTMLRFAATVWNAGDSPLVIDGFRDDRSQPDMDAYQYFVDSDGRQTGYTRLDSRFHYHEANHDHWHYEDFAAYRLLDSERRPVRTSGKVSFCLANTDAVDYTLPGADWRPWNTDLSTACGRPGSLTIREVLSAGSGDTYAQYRAGQAIRVADLEDGTYYVSVEPNPRGAIVESDYTNNTSEREITLTTRRDGSRAIEVSQVGVIEEPTEGFFGRR